MMRKFRIAMATALLTMLLISLAGTLPASAAPTTQTGPQTWTVLAGGQSAMVPGPEGATAAWTYTKFYPQDITVHAGDTIVWKLNSMEIHQVVFPAPGETYVPFIMPDPNNPQGVMINPLVAYPQGGSTYDGSALVSSGILGAPPSNTQTYSLTFPKGGTYNYLCPMHSGQLPTGQVVGMTGSVTVVAADQALPKTSAEVDADAQAAIEADNQAAAAVEPEAMKVAPPTRNADGTMTYHGNIGWDAGPMSYMRFSPTDFTIHEGDTIEWTQTSNQTPHTVSLYSGGTEAPTFITRPNAGGPPDILVNPDVLAPAGTNKYDGTGVSNSGWMPGAKTGEPGPLKYSLTFTRAGTYEYLCVLHDEMGMNGHITVLPAGSGTPGMPQTGQSTSSLLLMMALALGLALVLGGVTLVRRKARI